MRNINQSGITLVLSLLIMGTVSAVAVTLSILIINEVGTTKGINNAMKAYYSAETAIEQGTWIVSQARRSGASIGDAVALLTAPADGTLDDPMATWQRQAFGDSLSITTDLRRDESVFLDVYNPSGGNPPNQIKCHFDEWGGGTTKIEIAWTGWSPAGSYCPETRRWYPATCDGNTLKILDTPAGCDPLRYRMQLRSFDGPATNLTLNVYETDGITPVNIPSQVRILANGTYPAGSTRSATQALKAEIQWTLPVSGLFSYVLFSDQPLEKTL